MGLTPGQVAGKARVLNLPYRARGSACLPMRADHPAAIEGRTRFRRSVDRDIIGPVLKPGDNQRKLGRWITKGRWKGFPILSLTLEERATCPRSCEQWLTCMGNSMHLATRYAHGPRLEARIADELAALQARYPRGFAVRLHLLGDFYSLEYVKFWAMVLRTFPALHVWGYTHRRRGTRIGDAISVLQKTRPDRFAVRFSDAPNGYRSIVVASEANVPIGTIVCPVETGKTRNCGTCGLCWTTHKPIAFILH